MRLDAIAAAVTGRRRRRRTRAGGPTTIVPEGGACAPPSASSQGLAERLQAAQERLKREIPPRPEDDEAPT